MTDKVRIKTLLADYPITRALKSGQLGSDLIELDYADVPRANKGFKPFVREVAYDAGELAIVTFLQAVEHGVPLVLVPATIVGRFQHHAIVYNTKRGAIGPKDLEGRQVGVRAYTQTTGMWVRGILQSQFGVDLGKVTWLTFEDAHVAQYVNPPNVVLAPETKGLLDMLMDGELDAAMLGVDLPDDARLKTVIPDSQVAAREWYGQTGAIPVNHLLVVTQRLTRDHPDAVRELFRLIKQSKALSGVVEGVDTKPFGLEALRAGLQLAIDYSLDQKLLRRRVAVEELFNDVTIGLE